MHWSDTIDAIRAKKLELARLDPRGGMPVMPPRGASPSAIAAAERRLGFALPASYRAFLGQHDGWPMFFHGAGLLGVQQLTRGAFVDIARMVLEEHGASTEREPGLAKSHASAFVPFGIDPQAETLFAWDTGSARVRGELEIAVWINEIGDTVDSFPSLLDLVLDMLSAEVEARRARSAAFRGAAPASIPAPMSGTRAVQPAQPARAGSPWGRIQAA